MGLECATKVRISMVGYGRMQRKMIDRRAGGTGCSTMTLRTGIHDVTHTSSDSDVTERGFASLGGLHHGWTGGRHPEEGTVSSCIQCLHW